VEGVARRLDPDHDLWAAAQPIVERWIQRELGPAAQARDAVKELRDAVRGFARLTAQPPAATTVEIRRTDEPVGAAMALGLSLAAFGLAVAALAAAFLR
ncbi:MAG TPA: ubiquinone biosynthesis protein UbiB, partial [Caulobacteraceae bacterium]